MPTIYEEFEYVMDALDKGETPDRISPEGMEYMKRLLDYFARTRNLDPVTFKPKAGSE